MEYEPHYALRGQKTPPPGERPAPLSALRSDDGVDGTTLRFLHLLNLSLKKKQEEEEKERKRLERTRGGLCAGGCACQAPLAPAGEQARSAC